MNDHDKTTIKTLYNFEIKPHYHSNAEYRKCIRDIFFMDCKHNPEHDDIDEVTRDELTYDDTIMSSTLDFIYHITKDNVLFQELYELAAAKFISTNREIGLTVLLSYDYLPYFHNCLGCFVFNVFDVKSQFYKELKRTLQ